MEVNRNEKSHVQCSEHDSFHNKLHIMITLYVLYGKIIFCKKACVYRTTTFEDLEGF
jgi:hypothetical protein